MEWVNFLSTKKAKQPIPVEEFKLYILQFKRIIIELQETEFYKLSERAKIYVANFYVIIGLIELGIYANRAIETKDEVYFSGGVILAKEFNDEKWSDIHVFYAKLVAMVEEYNYFR